MLNSTAPALNGINITGEANETVVDRLKFWFDEDPYSYLERKLNMSTYEWIYYPEKTEA